MRWLWLLLTLAVSVASAGRLTTFAWDAGSNWPAGTTVELCGNGNVCLTGLTGTRASLDLSVQPGEVIQGRARAHAMDGRISEWATAAQTWPLPGIGLFARYKQDEVSPVTISATLLTSGSSSTQTNSYTTASSTAAANRLQLLAVSFVSTNAPSEASWPTVSVSGQDRTWTLVARRFFIAAGSNWWSAVHIFRAVGTAQTGALTISTSANVYNANWALVEIDDINTGGTNGSDAIVQTGTNNGGNGSTSTTLSLSAFAKSANGAFYVASVDGGASTRTQTPGTGLTELSDVGLAYNSMATYYATAEQTTLGTTISASTTGYGCIGVELNQGAAAVGSLVLPSPASRFSHLLVR